MDISKRMIIAKGKLISSKVTSCEFDSSTDKYEITFEGGKTYHYKAQNVSILQETASLNPEDYQIRYKGNRLENISAIHIFEEAGTEYWRICCSTGSEYNYCKDDLEIVKTSSEKIGDNQIFEYLKDVADNSGLETEDGTTFLAKQYEKIDVSTNETAASIYLNPEEFQPKTESDLSSLIFPFGCNESQYHAVCNALANRISVIEGPPGTGKTQTILNIIANLIIQGKTIQVISNNNSAIDNVLEKMAAPQYGVDFIAARLGNNENKEVFIENQTGSYPDLSAWVNNEYSTPEVLSALQKKLPRLLEVFKDKNLLAELRQKLYAIQLEQKHYEDMSVDTEPVISGKMLSSDRLMEVWEEYQNIQDSSKKTGLSYRLSCNFFRRNGLEQLMELAPADALNSVQGLYYRTAIEEIKVEITNIEKKLNRINADELVNEFTKMSLQYLRGVLAKRYSGNKERKKFETPWRNPNDFLKEYPVVLSTTYTARSSLGKYAQFDYVIMDESSQVDVVTGTLAISSAKNAVIVGDTKQLPNVVTSKQKEQLNKIFQKYNIPQAYDYIENSFLKSLCVLLGDRVPRVTLREHYRCHPQIIGFCNEKFYHGDLIVMTDQANAPALQLVTTDAGNHEFNHTNMRQFEAIRNEILPELSALKSQLGIIAPYRNQVKMLEKNLMESEIDIATVHKFQGREKDAIILSTVDDTVTKFSDDPNLLNVAVSRAKKKLVVVASDREQPVGSNIGDLIGYIRYNNCDSQNSEIRPVFCFFYNQLSESRHKALKKPKCFSELDYENSVYKMIIEELEHRENAVLGVVCHQHMNLIFRDLSKMSEEERKFISNDLPQLDFLIFNRVSKLPLLAIEADGLQNHIDSSEKTERDKVLKKHILETYGIPLLNLSEKDGSEGEKLAKELDRILRPGGSYTLVITEKPSVARAYAKVLGVRNKKYRYLEGNGYIISWCYGHLVELAEPEAYDEKYKRWNIKDLPIVPEQWQYQVKGKNKEQFNILKQLMNREDVTNILCATDAGREGELIFRLVYQQAECEKPFRRIWLSSMEESAIREAFANPKPASDYDTLYEAARCRQLADWLVGMNATRYFSCLYGDGVKAYGKKSLSVGRVVSPTMAMIVDREKERETFVSESYYTVNLNVGGVTFESRHLETEDEAIQIKQNSRGAILSEA